VDGAHGVLLSIQGGSDLGLFEINEAARLVQEAAHPEANIIFGAVIDDALGDEVRVTVIAAGFDGGAPTRRRDERALGQISGRSSTPAYGVPTTNGGGYGSGAMPPYGNVPDSGGRDLGALSEPTPPGRRLAEPAGRPVGHASAGRPQPLDADPLDRPVGAPTVAEPAMSPVLPTASAPASTTSAPVYQAPAPAAPAAPASPAATRSPASGAAMSGGVVSSNGTGRPVDGQPTDHRSVAVSGERVRTGRPVVLDDDLDIPDFLK
jgi:cell division protein FtsZ